MIYVISCPIETYQFIDKYFFHYGTRKSITGSRSVKFIVKLDEVSASRRMLSYAPNGPLRLLSAATYSLMSVYSGGHNKLFREETTLV